MMYQNGKVTRFLIPGFIATFYTWNLDDEFGVTYPVLSNIVQHSVIFFCFGLPVIAMIVFAFIPLNAKIRFYFGVGLGAAILSSMTIIQSLIQYHDLYIFSVDRAHYALTYSWIALVIGIAAIFMSRYDARAYEQQRMAYKKRLRELESERLRALFESASRQTDSYNDSYPEFNTNSSFVAVSDYYNDDKPPSYHSSSVDAQQAYDRGEYLSDYEFELDMLDTGGEGSK